MNNQYLDQARKRITDPRMLCLTASKRASQLAHGARPMVKTRDENLVDVALLEIAEGKLDYQFASADDFADEAAEIAARAAAQKNSEANN